MTPTVLPEPPTDSELARWMDDGTLLEPSHSNLITIIDPEDTYRLTVQVDEPVHGYLIQLFATERDDPIGRTLVDDRDTALQVAAEMAAAADDLDTLADRPRLGLETVHRADVKTGTVDPPEEWDDDADEWEDALEDAFEKAEIPRSKGTLTTKTIDGRDYYYLQWREGDKVKSQYVAPVSPA